MSEVNAELRHKALGCAGELCQHLLCVTTLQVVEWLDDICQGQFELAEHSLLGPFLSRRSEGEWGRRGALDL